MLRSANPMKSQNIFGPAETWSAHQGADPIAADRVADKSAAKAVRAKGHMTIQGTVNKSFLLLALCVTTAVLGWNLAVPTSLGGSFGYSPMLVTFGGAIAGLILAIITAVAPKRAPITAPLYALAEGFFVGGASAIFAMMSTKNETLAESIIDASIVFQAALGTFGAFAAMLIAYTTRLIKPTKKFRSVVVTATLGIMLFYLVSIGLSFFGISAGLGQPSLLGAGISGFIIIIASLNLILDFDFIEQGAANKIGTWGEWYGGFTLLVTLVWLYIEMLRLIWILRSLADD